jgi:hypothetical protein
MSDETAFFAELEQLRIRVRRTLGEDAYETALAAAFSLTMRRQRAVDPQALTGHLLSAEELEHTATVPFYEALRNELRRVLRPH